MEIIVKVRYNSVKERFDHYDKNRYIAYLSFADEGDDSHKVVNTKDILIGMVSKMMGVPPARVMFKQKDFMGNWVFDIG